MTISITGTRFAYTGNNSTTVFSFPRQFFLSTDLKVYLVNNTTKVATIQSLGTHYTVSGAGSPSGGNVTMVTAPTTSQTLVIYRDTPITQGLDLDSVQAFPLSSVEAALDRAMMAIDELNTEAVKGSLLTTGSFDYQLPVPVSKKFLRTNEAASGLEWYAPPSWLNGVGAPDASLGQVDDYYINTYDGSYYQKTNSTTWTYIGNLMGPPGSAGSASVNRELDTVTSLLANTTLTYTAGSSNTVATNDIIKVREGGHVYRVQASGASSYHVITTGGVKLNVVAGPYGYNVLAFGAKGDGTGDDSAAIQKAVDADKPTSVAGTGLPNKSSIIYFPSGTYLLQSSISIYTGTVLRGTGAASTLKAGVSLTTQIITLAPIINGQCRWVDISHLNFECTGSVRAIKSTAGLFLNSIIRDCTFNASYCIDLPKGTTYTQSCSFIRNVSSGPLDQFINISGNRNWIQDFNKEGGTGTTTDPYIFIDTCSEMFLLNTLIEGSGTVNKVPIKILGSGVTMSQAWFEISNTNGYSIDIDASTVHVTSDFIYIDASIRRIKVSNGSRVFFEYYNDSSVTSTIDTTLEIDSTSKVLVEKYKGRTFGNIYRFDNMKARTLIINRAESTTGVPANGYAIQNTGRWIGGNMLVNPSFEAGRYGWTVGGAPTITAEPSEVGSGLMLRMVYGASTSQNITQSFAIDANQVGVPFTFTGFIKIVAGDAGSWGTITASGCGLVGSGSDGFMSTASLGKGWQMVSQTFTPLTAGTLVVGFRMLNHTEVLLDHAYFGYGIEGETDRSRFGSVELNNKTFTVGSAAPTNGTWKVGDRVFNSTPSVGNPKSWVCTVAGTPGTWVSEGNL